MTIKAKLNLLLISWSFMILLISNIIIYFSYMKITEEREVDNLEDIGERLLEANTNDWFSPEMRPLFQSFKPDDGMIRLLDENESIAYRTVDEDAIIDLPIQKVIENETEVIHLDGEVVAVFRAPIYENNERIGTLELSRNMEDQFEDLQLLLTVLIGVSLLLIIVSMFFGNITSKLFVSPISIIGATMDRIQQEGKFEKINLPKKREDEIYQLSINFNRMIDYLEDMFKKQEQFINDASHELKTPLTVIESYSSMLKRWGKEDPDLLEEGIDVIHDESERLKRMVEQLLNLASVEQQPFELEAVNLTEVCKETTKRLEVSTKRAITVNALAEPIFGLTNKEKLVQILIILLDNAMKYSEKDISVNIFRGSEGAVIQVIDKGIGIPKEEISRLFERFYRVDKARTRTTGGSGLGLAIASSLVKRSKGTITIDSEENKGTTVTIVFQEVKN